jgi:alpha-ribazole phosphatase
MIKLCLVRHGETEWNASHRFQGQTDVPLNEKGRNQAKAIAQRLETREIHAIYASDLSRAWETATEIASHHSISIIPEPNLREASHGMWEGLTYDEIAQQYPAEAQAWQSDISKFSPPEGESIHQLYARVGVAYQNISQNHNDETILVVAHGGPLQMLICHIMELPATQFWQFRLANCSLSEIAIYEQGAIINSLNDTCHL